MPFLALRHSVIFYSCCVDRKAAWAGTKLCTRALGLHKSQHSDWLKPITSECQTLEEVDNNGDAITEWLLYSARKWETLLLGPPAHTDGV